MNHLQKAVKLVDDAWYDERGMKDVMRQDAAIHAAIAQAEALERIAVALERMSGLVMDGNYLLVKTFQQD